MEKNQYSLSKEEVVRIQERRVAHLKREILGSLNWIKSTTIRIEEQVTKEEGKEFSLNSLGEYQRQAQEADMFIAQLCDAQKVLKMLKEME